MKAPCECLLLHSAQYLEHINKITMEILTEKNSDIFYILINDHDKFTLTKMKLREVQYTRTSLYTTGLAICFGEEKAEEPLLSIPLSSSFPSSLSSIPTNVSMENPHAPPVYKLESPKTTKKRQMKSTTLASHKLNTHFHHMQQHN